MGLDYEHVVRTGIAKQIAENIRSAIVAGRLKIDERLPTEDELAARFGVSRPTVREALKRLAAQNLIRSRRGPTGGNFVVRPDPAGLSHAITGAATMMVGMGSFDIDQLITARLETEAICCRLAAIHRCDHDLTEMEAELTLQRDPAISDEAFCASDVRFHRALVNATANAPLQLMMYVVVEAFVPITNMVIFRVRKRHEIIDFHEALFGSIQSQDGDAAVVALTRLLAHIRKAYMRSTERRD